MERQTMVEIGSLSTTTLRIGATGPANRAVAPAVEERPALAALSALSVAEPSEEPREVGSLDFLYGPSGQAAAETQPARLAVQSADLDNLMSSLMSARLTQTPSEEMPRAPMDAQALIARLYSQF